jgi:MoxR-like ATPase
LSALRNGADHPRLVLDAALLALSARITLDETADTTPEHLITEIAGRHLGG